MERFELDRDHRADVYVDTDQPVFSLVALNDDRSGPADGHSSLEAAASAGAAVPIAEGVDVPANVRILLGDLNFDEAAEWVTRHSWSIHVGEGGVALCGGNEIFELNAIPDNDEDGANVLNLDLNPGTYRVVVYGLVPRDEAIESIEDGLEEHEDITSFFMATRSGETPPSWLQLYAMDSTDTELALRTEALENDELVYIHYIVQLIESSTVPATAWPEDGLDAIREVRMPSFCPMGIRSPKFESELLDTALPDDPMAAFAGGVDPMAMLGGMNPMEMIRSMSATDDGKAMLQQAAEMAKKMFQGSGMMAGTGASDDQLNAGFDAMMQMINGGGPPPDEAANADDGMVPEDDDSSSDPAAG